MGSPGLFRGLRGLSITFFMLAVEIQLTILIAGVYRLPMGTVLQLAWPSFVLAFVAFIANVIVFWLDKKPN